MIQDTLQRLRGGQQTQTNVSTSAKTGAMTLIALGAEQSQALNELFNTLDQSAPHKFIGLFGPRGSGKTTVVQELARDGLRGPRTPLHRKVVCAVMNAATLPSDIAPWQRMIFATLDALARQPGAPRTIHDLRRELEELITHEQRNDDSAALAGAAFAHHFRAAFSGIIHSVISLSNATFVLAIDHLDKADGENASQLLEASKYFINSQNCATLICADEAALVNQIDSAGGDGADALGQWLTTRIVLAPPTAPRPQPAAPVSPATATTKAPPKPIASDVPQPCVQILTDALGSDRYAVERAGESWRGAMRALARRNADGYGTRITATMIAKLCALKHLSPALFDAARFDAPLLANLERRARTPDVADTHDEWAETMAYDGRLMALFKATPTFIGVEPRDLATALRLVHAGDGDIAPAPQSNVLRLEPKEPRVTLLGSSASAAAASLGGAGSTALSTADAIGAKPAPVGRPRPEPVTVSVSPGIWTIVSVAASAFILDRLVKLAIQGGAASFGMLVQPVPLNTSGLLGNGLAIGAELIGLALCGLIVVFWGTKTRSLPRAAAFGLIGGGLAANVFDRVAYGAVMNYVHVGTLPVFNLAHVMMLCGALLLAYAILANDDAHRVQSQKAQ